MVLRVEHLRKSFQAEAETREILSDASLSVGAGESVAIMGPSGSGKSTLLNIIGTLDTPGGGRVEICGIDPFTLNAKALALFRNSNIGFIFQMHHLLPQCSVIENVLLPTVVKQPNGRRGQQNGGTGEGGKGRDETVTARAQRLIERVGLTARMHDRPARLSGGERQRSAVVRALINSPRILLADEPTGSLDHASAENIGTLLKELNKEENLALIVVTHTRELASRMDRVLQLRDGVLVDGAIH